MNVELGTTLEIEVNAVVEVGFGRMTDVEAGSGGEVIADEGILLSQAQAL